MRVSYNKIYEILIILVLFLNLGFINVFGDYTKTTFKISIVVSLIMFLIYIIQPSKHLNYNFGHRIYFGIVLIYSIIEFFISKNNITSEQIIYQYGGMILLLVAFPLAEIFVSPMRTRILEKIVCLGYAALLLKAITWIMYNIFHFNLFPSVWGYDMGWSRSILGINLVRLSSNFLIPLLIIYSLQKVLSHDSYKVLNIFGIIFCFFYILFISQYRMELVCNGLVVIFLLFINDYRTRESLTKNVVIACILVFMVILLWDGLKSFIGSFSINSELGGSTSFRIQEIQYFNNLWKNNIWTGFGLMPDMTIPFNGASYYLSDLGYMSNIFQFGIIGGILLIEPLLEGFIVRINHKNDKSHKNNSSIYFILIGLNLYMLLSMIPFNWYNPSLITLMPIYLSIIYAVESSY